MRNETQDKVNFLNRHGQFILREYVLVIVCSDLNYFSLLLFARGEVIPFHRAFTKPEERVLIDVMGELCLSRLNNRQVQLASQQEVEILGLITLLVKRLTNL